MAFPHRCSRCEKRHTFSRKWNQFVRLKRCWFCGNKRFYVDRWMQRRGRQQRCNCLGYWFPHRKGSKFCESNANYHEHMRKLRRDYEFRFDGGGKAWGVKRSAKPQSCIV